MSAMAMLRQQPRRFSDAADILLSFETQKAPSDDAEGALLENGDRVSPLQLSRDVKGSLTTQFCAFVRDELRILGVDLAPLRVGPHAKSFHCPVPLRLTVWVPDALALLSLSVPVRVPKPMGVKVTLTRQVAMDARTCGQLLV